MLCRDGKILVRLEDDAPDVTWEKGQLVLGSARWNCSHNVLKPEAQSIYARVADVRRPKDRVVELHTTHAGSVTDCLMFIKRNSGKNI